MRGKPKGLSIKSKLLLFSLCISLIPIAIITILYYINARNALDQRAFICLSAIASPGRNQVLSAL